MSLSEKHRQQLDESLETNDEGLYRVSQPVGGTAPSQITVRSNGIEYTFNEFVEAESVSTAFPDVLLYRSVAITAVGDDS